MKKRILSFILCLCLLVFALCLTSCNSTASVLEKALKKTQKLESYHVRLSVDSDTTVGETTSSAAANVEFKAVKGKDATVTWARSTVKTWWQSDRAEVYAEDDQWLYVSVGDRGYKVPAAHTDGAYDYMAVVEHLLRPLPDDLTEDTVPTENNDGSQTFTYSLSQEAFWDLYRDLMADVTDDATQITVSDTTVHITVRDGYVIRYELIFVMGTPENGGTRQRLDLALRFMEPGSDVTVTPPTGYTEFEAVDRLPVNE